MWVNTWEGNSDRNNMNGRPLTSLNKPWEERSICSGVTRGGAGPSVGRFWDSQWVSRSVLVARSAGWLRFHDLLWRAGYCPLPQADSVRYLSTSPEPGHTCPERAMQPSPQEREVNSVRHKQNQRPYKQPRKTHRALEILAKTTGATITTVEP